MVRCCVNTSKSDTERKLTDLSFHSFPSNNDLRKLWIEAIGQTNWEPKKSSRICSLHFYKTMLIKKIGQIFLMPNAVPNPSTT